MNHHSHTVFYNVVKMKKDDGNKLHTHRARKEIRRMVIVLVAETSPEAIAGVSDFPFSVLNPCAPLAFNKNLSCSWLFSW